MLAGGVGALHALFWTLLNSGDRVVYPKVSYMAVYRLFHELFNRKLGVETVMVDMTDLEAVKKVNIGAEDCRMAGAEGSCYVCVVSGFAGQSGI